MYRILLLLLLAFSVRSEITSDATCLSRSRIVSTTDFIQSHGYPNETHVVTTSDGYILQIHRIPYGRNKVNYKRGPVFLMAGFQCSSADWVVAGPELSLAYVLADAGFDVWMGNARGSKYSRKHVKLNPDSNIMYWDFSWHEIGVIDIPNMIDYVLEVTGESQLMYVGYSQGTTSFFVMASELPEYNQKIKIMHAFAPVVFMDHVGSLFKASLPILEALQHSANVLTGGEFLHYNEEIALFGSVLCKEKALQGVCSSSFSVVFGFDLSNLNKTLTSDILKNFPAGSSTKQGVHYAQVATSGKFVQYDHSKLTNLLKYNKLFPPKYNLKQVTAKVALYVGPNDNLATPKDVKKLATLLPNVVEHYLIPHEDFTHIDFVYGVHVPELLYGKLFEVTNKYV